VGTTVAHVTTLVGPPSRFNGRGSAATNARCARVAQSAYALRGAGVRAAITRLTRRWCDVTPARQLKRTHQPGDHMACGPGRFYHARYSGAAGVGRRRSCGGGGRRTATDGVQVWRGRVPRRHVAHGEEPQPLFLQVPGGESVALLPLVRGGDATGICSSSLFKFALFQNRRTTHLLPYPITLLQLLGSSTPSLQRSISLAESSGVCVSNRELSLLTRTRAGVRVLPMV